jgi:hypothetical protein
VGQDALANSIEISVDERSVLARQIADSELPARISRYRIEKLLGKGGFGLVYLAQDEQLHRSVAIKVPHTNRVACPEDADPYLAEARAVTALTSLLHSLVGGVRICERKW